MDYDITVVITVRDCESEDEARAEVEGALSPALVFSRWKIESIEESA